MGSTGAAVHLAFTPQPARSGRSVVPRVFRDSGKKMGIKFLCPNGHKLHVKSFLSGKRAICPKCGVRVVVPAESTTESSADLPRADGSESAPSVELDESLLADSGSTLATTAATPAKTQTTASDPIAEAPSAVWYVRPASGGQFGPASGEIMRGWIDDGRVGASSLVWRAGWTEWRSAAAIFPQLSSLLVAPGPPLQQVPLPSATVSAGNLPRGHVAEMLPPSPPAVSATVPPLAEMSRRRRRKKDVSLLASAVLVGLTVILIIILALVFRAQNAPKAPDVEPAPAAKTGALDLTPISPRG